MRRLTTLFPSEFLEEHAEELGVVEREGKLQIPVLVWALVFGFAAGESRTLAGFRRSYNSTADETISPGGFYHRLTPTLAEYLRDLVEAALDEVAVPDAVDADIDRFRDVIIADGTVLRLHEFLSDEFQARHEEQAGAKLHLLHNATDQTIERIDVTDEKAHDSTLFKTGSWLCGRLVLFDKAYFKYRRFALIDENDGYFVSRLKQNANPVITAELQGMARARHSLWRASRSRTWLMTSRGSTSTWRSKRSSSAVSTKERDHWTRSGSASSASATRTPTTTILYHESTARGVPAVRSADAVPVSVGGRNAVP